MQYHKTEEKQLANLFANINLILHSVLFVVLVQVVLDAHEDYIDDHWAASFTSFYQTTHHPHSDERIINRTSIICEIPVIYIIVSAGIPIVAHME